MLTVTACGSQLLSCRQTRDCFEYVMIQARHPLVDTVSCGFKLQYNMDLCYGIARFRLRHGLDTSAYLALPPSFVDPLTSPPSPAPKTL